MQEETKNTETTVVKDLVFRPLRADEIEVRHSDPEYGKVKLLLYKNARVDMNILDETVGPLNWQRDYHKEGELLFCKIGIKHPKTGEWIWKTDTGSPTEYDAEKGWVSDAFKRTAVCFGIGRELYTGPKIVIPVDEEMDNYKGKYCQDFRVNEIDYSNGVITKLVIVDRRGRERFAYPNNDRETRDIVASNYTRPKTSNGSWSGVGDSRSRVEKLEAFYDKMKEREDVDKGELERMRKWLLAPDKGDHSKKRVETLSPEPTFDIKMWQWWCNRIKKA